MVSAQDGVYNGRRDAVDEELWRRHSVDERHSPKVTRGVVPGFGSHQQKEGRDKERDGERQGYGGKGGGIKEGETQRGREREKPRERNSDKGREPQ